MTFKAYSRRLEDSGAIICPDNINPKKKKKGLKRRRRRRRRWGVQSFMLDTSSKKHNLR